MPHDRVLITNTGNWLVKASQDLRAVEICLSAEPPHTEDAFFHCQQAVEKALKAFLTWHDQPFGKTHDLGLIGGLCVELDATLQEIVGRVGRLTQFA